MTPLDYSHPPELDVGQFLPGDEGVVASHLPDGGAHLALVLVHQLVVFPLLVRAGPAPAAVETGGGGRSEVRSCREGVKGRVGSGRVRLGQVRKDAFQHQSSLGRLRQ